MVSTCFPGLFLIFVLGFLNSVCFSLDNGDKRSGAIVPFFKSGNNVTCTNEGQEVKVEFISENPCFTCRCKNGVVGCDRQACPFATTCYYRAYGENRSCCDVCLSCRQGNKTYNSESQWTNSKQPCLTYSCESGIITESRIICHTSCRYPIPADSNECCPKCQGCLVNGMNYSDGQKIPSEIADPCITCTCQKGNVNCQKKACPVLPCPPSKFVQRGKNCCPECVGYRRLLDPKDKCYIGSDVYHNGQSFIYDQCTHCFCNMSITHCTRQVCPPLECPPSHQMREPEQCCPHCRRPDEVVSICIAGEKIYQNGQQWKEGCSSCNCRHGKVKCTVELCKFHSQCPSGHKRVNVPGKCCPICLEDDGVCTVFGDPHYRTFDGKTFNFQGICKYTLVSDCKGKRFTIQVVNEGRYSKMFSWTKSVILKIGDLKVVLGQYRNIKVGKKRVRLPFIKLGTLSIRDYNYTVTIRTNMGIRLNWDGNSYLEVFVPSYFKGQLCGLCGNYNGNPNDDFFTKKGNLVTAPDDFGNSWIIGKGKKCFPPQLAQTSQITCDSNPNAQAKAYHECDVLKSEVFRPCHEKVLPMPYHRSCMMDMCECPLSRRCHCESLFAYAEHCKRSGVKLDWRKTAGCEGSHCPRGSVYKTCAQRCRKTCKNYRISKPCKRKCKPGCECINGTVWYRNKCVPVQTCPV